MGTDVTTLTEEVEPISFAAAGDRLLTNPSSFPSTTCPGESERSVRDATSENGSGNT